MQVNLSVVKKYEFKQPNLTVGFELFVVNCIVYLKKTADEAYQTILKAYSDATLSYSNCGDFDIYGKGRNCKIY